jgi:hypothetical protein
MRKSLQFVFSVMLFAGFEANADSIEEICAHGDSDSFMEICARREQAAKTRVDNMDVSDRIFDYCARIADGSYSLIESCILKGQQAKARLGYPDT